MEAGRTRQSGCTEIRCTGDDVASCHVGWCSGRAARTFDGYDSLIILCMLPKALAVATTAVVAGGGLFLLDFLTPHLATHLLCA